MSLLPKVLMNFPGIAGQPAGEICCESARCGRGWMKDSLRLTTFDCAVLWLGVDLCDSIGSLMGPKLSGSSNSRTLDSSKISKNSVGP